MSEWHIISSRPMTDEERNEYNERTGFNLTPEEAVIFTGPLPDDGQEVLIYCVYSNRVRLDTFFDEPDGCGFEEHGDMDGIVAWMPLPEPPGGWT